MTLYAKKSFFYIALGLYFLPISIHAEEPTEASSLTEYMQDSANTALPAPDKVSNTDNNQAVSLPPVVTQEQNDTWINNLVSTVAEKGADVISPKPTPSSVHRSNASVFDISGVMLRMNRQQVEQALQKRGYRKTAEQLEIPNFIRWRYEEICRNQGVVGFERIGNCVVKMAKQNNFQYVQHEKYANFNTKEEVEIFYTSNFTGNKVHRIMYHSEAANITGSGAKATYLRNLKVFDFWKKINQKYGTPDNREQVIWGMGDNKPSLQAATGRLILKDPMLLELDYTRMSREDQKFMNTATYTF